MVDKASFLLEVSDRIFVSFPFNFNFFLKKHKPCIGLISNSIHKIDLYIVSINPVYLSVMISMLDS